MSHAQECVEEETDDAEQDEHFYDSFNSSSVVHVEGEEEQEEEQREATPMVPRHFHLNSRMLPPPGLTKVMQVVGVTPVRRSTRNLSNEAAMREETPEHIRQEMAKMLE